MSIDEEPQHQKQADNIANIIITIKRIEQRKHIELRIMFLHHTRKSQHHKREYHDAVKPHRIPVIPDHIVAQRIAHRDCNDQEASLFLSILIA